MPIEEEEEAGLRAFALTVGCHSEASYPDRPAWIEVDGVRIDVDLIESQWREEERLGFRLRMSDGSRMLVYYVPELDLWSGLPQRRAIDASPCVPGG